MAFIGPMFGQVGYFHKFAGREIADKRPLERYRDESKRLLGVLETRLAGRQWIMGDDYTIADISMLGWVRNLVGFYGAGDLVGVTIQKLLEAEHVLDALERRRHAPADGGLLGGRDGGIHILGAREWQIGGLVTRGGVVDRRDARR